MFHFHGFQRDEFLPLCHLFPRRHRHRDDAARHGGEDRAVARTLVTEQGRSWQVTPWRAATSGATAAGDGAILAPMPGRIIAVSVAPGDKVTKGQKLVTLEAMKMEHGLTAPFDGIVEDMPHDEGAQVQEGMLLARIVAEDAT